MPAETETARRDVDARRATRGVVTESFVVANMMLIGCDECVRVGTRVCVLECVKMCETTGEKSLRACSRAWTPCECRARVGVW